jgi:hypothetical protein
MTTRLTFSLAAFAAAGLTFGATAANAALVAHFPVDSATDSSTFLDDVVDDSTHGVTDGTGNNETGSIVNDATRGDVLKTVQGHRFSAGTQDINLSEGFTWSLWVKSDSSANNAEGDGADVIIGSRNGAWNKVQPTGTERWFSFSYDVDDDTWHHLAYTGALDTNDDPVGEFWVDGTKVDTDTDGTSNGNTTLDDPMEIGGSSRFSEDYAGLIDDIGVWNERLSDSRIQDIANGGAIPEPASLALMGLGGLMLLPRRKRA